MKACEGIKAGDLMNESIDIRLEQVGKQSQGLAQAAWQYMQDCKKADNGYTAGLGCLENFDSAQAVEEAWVRQAMNESEGKNLPDGWVPAVQFYALNQDEQIVGMLNMRLQLSDFLLNDGGNIGYSVHPSFRRRGVAHAMLSQCLDYARDRGMHRLLLTCSADNVGSKKTILSCGGKFEDSCLIPGEGVHERYWIDLES